MLDQTIQVLNGKVSRIPFELVSCGIQFNPCVFNNFPLYYETQGKVYLTQMKKRVF